MKKNSNKELITEPKKTRTHSINELRERKKFMIKMSLITMTFLIGLSSLVIPLTIFL